MRDIQKISFICMLAAAPQLVHAGGVPTAMDPYQEVVVTGRIDELGGMPISATAGVVTSEQLELRPVLRTGELLEVVPGLIVTQHSGDGKANQYFLRGFNLDHGTDLSTSVDDVPINMPTHAHGHGYTDLNFVIPELVESVDYRKGTYYADEGDFSAAGAVNLRYRDTLDATMALLELGENDYRRALLAASPQFGDSALLIGIEQAQSDGPWLLDQDLRRTNVLLRYSRTSGTNRLALTAQGYDGVWRSTDQIPRRAVQAGTLERYGTVDQSDGGESHRYSIGLDWTARVGVADFRARAFAIDYGLDLFSNFTYAVDQENGDQFEQLDERRVYGASASLKQPLELFGSANDLELGAEWRRDDIGTVGLYRTIARERIDTTRQDSVEQNSYSAYASVATAWSEHVRTAVGVRADYFEFDVESTLAVNSGRAADRVLSPKFSLVLGPWNDTEFFVNFGRGFHSNDARGTTIRVDPTDSSASAERVDPLVDAVGADVGLRTAILPHMQVSLSLWTMHLDSELLFIGDAGLTEPSRASTRRGVELGAIWNPTSWLILDADLAWSRGRFEDDDPVGDRIPGAVDRVASIGLAIDHPTGWFGGARFRHLGGASLIEDGSVESQPTTLVNLELGYRLNERLNMSAAVFNAFDRRDSDITYLYESQLQDEAAPVEDIHFHPVEPRTVRMTLTGSF